MDTACFSGYSICITKTNPEEAKRCPRYSLNPFFDFCRVRVANQSLDQEKQLVTITLHPDERYDPVCSHCQHKMKSIHSYHERTVRDLNCFDSQTTLTIRYRTVRCPRCGNRVEELNLVHPGKRVTKRLAQ